MLAAIIHSRLSVPAKAIIRVPTDRPPIGKAQAKPPAVRQSRTTTPAGREPPGDPAVRIIPAAPCRTN